MFDPETDTLIFEEGTGTPGTTVTWTTTDLVIEEVTVDVINPDPDASPLEELEGLVITWDGPSFTFNATFATWFSRRTTFVKEEGVIGQNITYSFSNQVARPNLLPESFYGVHKVESPPRFLTLVFTVIGTETVSTEGEEGEPPTSSSGPFEGEWTCTVRHDYGANIIAVRDAVEKGDAYKIYQEI
jgi:hypothetical protein